MIVHEIVNHSRRENILEYPLLSLIYESITSMLNKFIGILI